VTHLEQVGRAAQRVREAEHHLEKARANLQTNLVAAVSAGCSLSALGEHLGLSSLQVAQLVKDHENG
jgi:hypothetical protein